MEEAKSTLFYTIHEYSISFSYLQYLLHYIGEMRNGLILEFNSNALFTIVFAENDELYEYILQPFNENCIFNHILCFH